MLECFAALGALCHSVLVRFVVASVVLFACACSSSSPTVSAAACATDPRVEAFDVPLSAKGTTGASVVIQSATPSLVQEGDNNWTVAIHGFERRAGRRHGEHRVGDARSQPRQPNARNDHAQGKWHLRNRRDQLGDERRVDDHDFDREPDVERQRDVRVLYRLSCYGAQP